MCGRYRRTTREEELARIHHIPIPAQPDLPISYNIAPSQPVLAIRFNPETKQRSLDTLIWGLVPYWSKDGNTGFINARAERIDVAPAFRRPFQKRRCLIPADGFYEWQRTGKVKQPYCFEVNDGELFAFAGIWDRWTDPNRNAVETFSILTTSPNAVTSAVHDRMPVILDRDSYDMWLDPGLRDVTTASELLKPCDAQLMRCYPISTRINHVANDDQECSAPIELAQIQNSLFS